MQQAASVQQLSDRGAQVLQCSRWLWLFRARIGCSLVKEAAHRAKQSNLAACKTLHTAELCACYAPMYATLIASDR